MMGDRARPSREPAFRRLLLRRSRWRWGLSIFLIGVYLAWAVSGIYATKAYTRPFMGSAIPWGMAMGLMIIVLSIILSPTVWVDVLGNEVAIFPYTYPTLFSVAAAFAVTLLMSVTDGSEQGRAERLAFPAHLVTSEVGDRS